MKESSTEKRKKGKNQSDETMLDLKLSWKFLKRNYKAFSGIGLFVFLTTIILNVLILVLLIRIQISAGNEGIGEYITAVEESHLNMFI